MVYALAMFLLSLVSPSPVLAAVPVLLRDVNQYLRREDIAIRTFEPVAVGGKLYFIVTRPDTGTELGVVDGTTGAFDVLDLRPGEIGSMPIGLTAFGTLLLFQASANDHGTELWLSNGTAGGTSEVEDIRAGSAGSNPFGFVSLEDGTMAFAADDGVHGREIWRTDGTPAGTNLLFDLRTGFDGGDPRDMVFFQPGFLMFSALGAGIGREPWFAALGGFMVLKDIAAGTDVGSFPARFASRPTPLRAFFAAGGAAGSEPWVTDFSEEGTTLLKDVEPGDQGSIPADFRVVGGTMVFSARSSGEGREWWRTDGSPDGTTMIPSTYPGTHDSVAIEFPTAAFGANRLVVPSASADGGIEPAIFDGATVTRLTDVFAGRGSSYLSDDYLGSTRVITTTTRAYVGLDDGEHGWELWQTDGTPDGTTMLADLLPGPASSRALPVAVEGDTVYVFAYGPNGFGLWKVSAGGAPILLTPLSLAGTEDAGIFSAARAGARVLFSAFDGEAGLELWATDGTASGTQRVADLVPGFGAGIPLGLAGVGQRAFFAATDVEHGFELFVSDGTAAGTALVRDIVPGDGGSFPGFMTPLGDRVVFAAATAAEGREPWVSDGTAAGTTLLKDIRPGPLGSVTEATGGFTAVGDLVFFRVITPPGSTWRTDGTPGGTIKLSDVVAQPSPVRDFVAFGNGVLFEGTTPDEGTELWFSDGTPQGTRIVTDLVSGPVSSLPEFITPVDERAFFIAGMPPMNRELWVTDGSAAGTMQVAEIVPGMDGAFLSEMAPLPAGVVFTLLTLTGRELWVSDGTGPGTHPIEGICPVADCHPQALVAYDGVVFFNFDDGVHGAELWRTDGTSAGTAMVADSAPGPASFTFESFTTAFLDGKVFLVGCEDEHGCEPWLYDYDQCFGDPTKLAPGICGCGVPDVDADASGVSDCLIVDELRARIDVLVALIEPLTKPRSKAERAALKEKLRSVREALGRLVAYRDAHADAFTSVKKPFAKAKKVVRRLTRSGRRVSGPRVKALAKLAALRQAL